MTKTETSPNHPPPHPSPARGEGADRRLGRAASELSSGGAEHGFTNLGDLIRRDRDLSKIAVIDLGGETSPREFSYAQLDAMANGVARALVRRGLVRGDRVAILSANRAEYLAAYYGIMRAGLVAVPVNFKFPRQTIHFILQDSGAKLLFCDRARLAGLPRRLAVGLFRRLFLTLPWRGRVGERQRAGVG